MAYNYVLDWQKENTEQPNVLNVLGLFMLSNVDQRFFSDQHIPITNSTPHGNSQFKGDLVQDSEEVITKIVNSRFNHTNYNSVHFLASDSLETELDLIKLKTGLDLIKSNEISLLLLSTPSIKSGRYDSKNTINTLNAIIDLKFKGKIVGITHSWYEKELEKECSKRKIPIVTLEENNLGYNHACYRFRLERAIIDYFEKPNTKPDNQPTNNIPFF